MNAPHRPLHQTFVLRIWHGFESPAYRALLREALEALRGTHPVNFRSACAAELGDDADDASHAHCIALDTTLPHQALSAQLLAIARDGRPLILVGDEAHPVARLATEHGCAITVPDHSAQALVDAVRALLDDPLRASLMGLRAKCLHDRMTTQR